MTGPQPAQAPAVPGREWTEQSRAAHASPIPYSGWKRQAWLAARWGMCTLGRPLSPLRMRPAFLLVGAERCGTTSMFDVLRQHPAIVNGTLPRKEMHFFDHKYTLGLAWYQCHFPLLAHARLAARGAGEPVAFEATPNYMFHPLAPERIATALPGVRLLVNVRNPVERAYSAYAHQKGFGFETETFERALELEESRVAGEVERIIAEPGYFSFSHSHHTYKARGYYADQLERLEKLVGRDHIHVVDDGDFFAAPGPVLDGVLDFLQLPRRGEVSFRPQNSRPRQPMPDEVKAELEEHFRPHDERLAAWLGREPSWRR